MNDYRENFIDQTEVAKTKIKEREETKRQKHAANLKSPYYLFLCTTIIVGTFCSFLFYAARRFPGQPDAPDTTCTETTQIIKPDDRPVSCRNGTTEVKPLGTHSEMSWGLSNETMEVLVQCKCPRATGATTQ